MSPGGAGCSAGLLLTVGWLLLAGLEPAWGTNVTAFQDPGLGGAEGEGEGEGENENENEGEDDSGNYMGDAESAPRAEAEDDSEGRRLLGGDEGTC